MNDKILHFTVGALIALLAGCILDPITGFMAATVIGAGKEVWDYFNDGCPELADFIVTVIGGALGSLVVWLVVM